MNRIRKTLLYDFPSLVVTTTKNIVTFPHRAIVSAINLNRKLGVRPDEEDWFDYDVKPKYEKLHDHNRLLDEDVDIESKKSVESTRDVFNLHADKDTFCGRQLQAKMVHRYQVYDKILDLSELSVTHTSEVDSVSEMLNNSLDSIVEVEDEEDLSESIDIPVAESQSLTSDEVNENYDYDNVSLI